jgi:hypothetical protein
MNRSVIDLDETKELFELLLGNHTCSLVAVGACYTDVV